VPVTQDGEAGFHKDAERKDTTMTTQKYREGVVYERADVPEDYLPLWPVEAEDPSLRRHIADLCQRGEVRRFRCGKKMFVHKDDIESARTRWHKRKQSKIVFESTGKGNKGQAERQQPQKYEQLLDALVTLLGAVTTNQATLIVAVERLAIAAEQIAKQPLARMDDVAIAEPSGTWRDMNGEAL
jgi:hypothetical protein